VIQSSPSHAASTHGRTPPAGLLAAERARRARQDSGSWAVTAPLSAAFMGLLVAEARPVMAEIARAGHAPVPAGVAGGPGGSLAGGAGTPHLQGSAGGDDLADPRQLSLFAVGEGTAGDARAGIALPQVVEGEAIAVDAPTGPGGGGDVSVTFNLGAGAGGSGLDAPYPEDDGWGQDGENLPPLGRVVRGTPGDDVIIGSDDADNLAGGDGNDRIEGRGGNDVIDGGAGDDDLSGGDGNDTVDGGTGNDDVRGDAGDDQLDGGDGDDTVDGGSGNDDLRGGEGDDQLDGGTGIDIIRGEGGNDVIYVDHLHDVALENREGWDGGGQDTIVIRAGFASSLAAALPDLAPQGLATFVTGADLATGAPEGANPYVQRIHPEIENVRLAGDAAHDIVGDGRDQQLTGNAGQNLIWGGAGDDVIEGRGGDDRLWGDAGNDQLHGGTGNDMLYGGAGDDQLDGGLGDDQLHGGGGDDLFVFGLAEGRDRVFDTAGTNAVRFDGVAAERISMAISGQDLVIKVDGVERAVIDTYVGNEARWSGLELGDGVQGFDAFLPGGGGRVATAQADMLAAFMPDPAQAATPDLLLAHDGSGWVTSDAGPEGTPAEPGPFGLAEDATPYHPSQIADLDGARELWAAVDTTRFDPQPDFLHGDPGDQYAMEHRAIRPEDLVD
jgi:Ca2+-binding RTX toxin-like protein